MQIPFDHGQLFTKLPDDIRLQLPKEYEAISNAKMVQNTLNYSKAQLAGYFHKYFIRSYIETSSLFNYLLQNSTKYKTLLFTKRRLRILDIGTGIGANSIALLKNINDKFNNIKSIEVDAIDGNLEALNYEQKIIKFLKFECYVKVNPVHHIFNSESLIPDLKHITNSAEPYDIVISSKFINEFYRKEQHITGVYSSIIKFSHDVLNENGILFITELTDRINSPHDNRYLNKVFKNETVSYFQDYKDSLKYIVPLPCHLWQNVCQDSSKCFVQQQCLGGISKFFTQAFCFKSLSNNFYDYSFIEKWRIRPIRINISSLNLIETFFYIGKLLYDNQISSDFYY